MKSIKSVLVFFVVLLFWVIVPVGVVRADTFTLSQLPCGFEQGYPSEAHCDGHITINKTTFSPGEHMNLEWWGDLSGYNGIVGPATIVKFNGVEGTYQCNSNYCRRAHTIGNNDEAFNAPSADGCYNVDVFYKWATGFGTYQYTTTIPYTVGAGCPGGGNQGGGSGSSGGGGYPVIQLSGNPNPVYLGGTMTLTWDTFLTADDCTLKEGTQTIGTGATGSLPVVFNDPSQIGTHTYNIECYRYIAKNGSKEDFAKKEDGIFNKLFSYLINKAEADYVHYVYSYASVSIDFLDIPSLPDLTAGPSSPTIAIVNTSVNLTSSISNTGNDSTGGSFDSFFQVATAASGGGIISDLPPINTPNINAGANHSISQPYMFGSAGTSSVRACADKSNRNDSGTVTESDENNNCGDWVNVVVNSAAVNGLCNPQHFLCDVGASINNVSGTTSYTWDCEGSNGGTTMSCSEPKPNFPNLTSSASSPVTALINTPVTLTATVSNIGNVSTGTGFNNFFQLSTYDPTGGNGNSSFLFSPQIAHASGGGVILDLTPSVFLGALPSGENGQIQLPYTFSLSGLYYVRACADKSNRNDSGTITESYENDNCGPWTATLADNGMTNLPDLTAGTISPTSALVNTSVNLSASISNTGNDPTGASFNNFIQVADQANGVGNVKDLLPDMMNDLSPGASNITQNAYIFPFTGTFSARACADKSDRSDTGTIVELSEINNCGPWTNIIITTNVVNGHCHAEHYKCIAGIVDNVATPATPPDWRWDCKGLSGGTTDNCTEAMPVNYSGVCATTHFNCILGNSINNTGNGNSGWSWQCVGPGGTVSCSQAGSSNSCNFNHVKDGLETGVDCGGPYCPVCKVTPKYKEN